ncbi:MAG TPA: TlyA family RNA methyltransferase [Deltaproteobacteria bacterium]|nr:TlyA family RNA methyltransferase [Deltaproteobacteria bacterium]HRW80380.1 TlyA family RNA methyltransferase [Desulfomonilia bacterium]NMD40525.1 TlyA family RNA methyltransferase [Deltaproteobacteria bacterium]HNQ86245.1 TlyA family RNA methyltransferase [Deltaproteobacteria bacterium]HNS89398.1 TlyA family RNA methyltransferase [Deltaproteobacteria bacterium]
MRSRLDKVLVDRGLAQTRAKALGLIMAGQVVVDGRAVTKAGTPVGEGATITLAPHREFVGRGALKLEAALDAFLVDVKGMTVVDVGSSTGGFTEVLLKRGARRVYAVDVGHGQLHWRLRNDPRVVCREGVNARFISREHVPEDCDMAVFDVSFISLKLVIPPVLELLRDLSSLVALIKPQFEAGRGQVGRGGIVRDPAVQDLVVADMTTFFQGLRLDVSGVIPSPVKGARGNQEYLIHATRKVVPGQ